MAESVTTIVPILGGLYTFLETVSISEVRKQVERAEGKLELIQHRLHYAESRKKKDEWIQNWVKEMRQGGWKIEDVLDTFHAKVERYYAEEDFAGKTKRYLRMPIELNDRREISSSINKIMENIVTTISKDPFNSSKDERSDPLSGILLQRRRRDAWEEDQPNVVVGLNEKINELVKRLVEGESRRCVISVVGQAGLGKTVLAKEVYNRAKSSFSSAAWIHVPNHDTNGVLRKLWKALRQLSENEMKETNEDEMRRNIATKLKEKKYFVVLDDVRTSEAWDAVRGALPDENTRSRVLMTTQNVGVAKHADLQTDPCMLPLLKEKEGHELFCRIAFPKHPHSCPHELKSLATTIVQRCGGLPLALVALGDVLSKKETIFEAWKDVVAGLDWEITKGKGEIASILALSFDDLTFDLKRCLLYCCAFPGGREIRVRRLFRQWIAEGFVRKEGRRRLEAVAMGYLVELVERSLIQPCKRNCFGQIKSCRVHDVLLQTLVSTAEEQNFFQIHPAADGDRDLSNCRRLAVHHRLEETTLPLSLARSFICFEKTESPIGFDLVQNFLLLKVLDLEGVHSVKKLPKEIGDLVLLRYLGLRDTSIETLPRSIKHLYNLQTLDLRTSANVSLSRSRIPLMYFKAKHVTYMTSLRHLYFGNRLHENAMEVLDDFGAKRAFKELQTLSYVKAGGWVVKGLPNMTSLVKLGLKIPEGYSSKTTLGAIKQLKELDSLYLRGGLEDLPSDAFVNLTKLTLDSSCLQDDPLSGLRTLQSLKSLKLVNNACNCDRMGCSNDGFPNLEVLRLEHLDCLVDMDVESGAFPRLKYMRIAKCNNLLKVPEGLGTMRSLKELKLIDMASSLGERIQPDEGSDWPKIKHIPAIIFISGGVERKIDAVQINQCRTQS